jgi:hypothetical protein
MSSSSAAPSPAGGVRVDDLLLQSAGGGALMTPPAPGPSVSVYPTTFYSAGDAMDPGVIVVAPGDERTGVDIRLRPSPAARVSVTNAGGPFNVVCARSARGPAPAMTTAEAAATVWAQMARSRCSASRRALRPEGFRLPRRVSPPRHVNPPSSRLAAPTALRCRGRSAGAVRCDPATVWLMCRWLRRKYRVGTGRHRRRAAIRSRRQADWRAARFGGRWAWRQSATASVDATGRFEIQAPAPGAC